MAKMGQPGYAPGPSTTVPRTVWRDRAGKAVTNGFDYVPGGMTRGLTSKELRAAGQNEQAAAVELLDEEERKRKAAEEAAKATAAMAYADGGG